jgi:hypothetical protein
MTDPSTGLYLDLLKKTLTFLLWEEPPVPMERYAYLKPPLKRKLIHWISAQLRKREWQWAKLRRHSQEKREEGWIWPGLAHTMVGLKRLDNLQFCVESILRDKVEGDLIETGVWRGGSCIFMRAILAAHGDEHRRVFVADSFAGLPRPDEKNYPADKGDTLYMQEVLAVSQEEVEDNFRKYGLLDERVVFLKGWFKDTLPTAPIEKLSVLRLDGDMYSSTMDALNNLYPKLSSGGYCIIDDYALKTCEEAVRDFRQTHGIKAEIKTVDWTGVYWRKE